MGLFHLGEYNVIYVDCPNMKGMELLNIYRTRSLQEMIIYLIRKINKNQSF
jgi:hypothetical protein